jgi:hypothetical protein
MAAVQIRVGQLLSTSRATQAMRRSCCRAAMQCCKYGWQQCKCKAPPWAFRGSLITILGIAPFSH